MLVALHTAEVSVGDEQSENEATYAGYARAENSPDNVIFPAATAASPEYLHFFSVADEDGIITSVGSLKPPILVSSVGFTPVIQTI